MSLTSKAMIKRLQAQLPKRKVQLNQLSLQKQPRIRRKMPLVHKRQHPLTQRPQADRLYYEEIFHHWITDLGTPCDYHLGHDLDVESARRRIRSANEYLKCTATAQFKTRTDGIS